jgi:hypothetical protein
MCYDAGVREEGERERKRERIVGPLHWTPPQYVLEGEGEGEGRPTSRASVD